MTTILAWLGGIVAVVAVVVGLGFIVLSGLKPGDMP